MKRRIHLTELVTNYKLLLGLSLRFPQTSLLSLQLNFTLKHTSALLVCNAYKDVLSSLVLHYSQIFVERLELRDSKTGSRLEQQKTYKFVFEKIINARGCMLKISGAVYLLEIGRCIGLKLPIYR